MKSKFFLIKFLSIVTFLVAFDTRAETNAHLGIHCFNLSAIDYPDESCASISRSGVDWTGIMPGWGTFSLGFDPRNFATQASMNQIILSPIRSRSSGTAFSLSKFSILINSLEFFKIKIGRLPGIGYSHQGPSPGLSGMHGYEGWDQLGLKVDWIGLDSQFEISMQTGNGEGEWSSNRSGGDYLGFYSSYKFPGFAKIFLASSLNSSSINSSEWASIYPGRVPQDAETKRSSLGLSIEDSLSFLRGFFLEANLRRITTTLTGLDSEHVLDDGPYDPQQWWTPGLGGWLQDSAEISMSYRILRVYGISLGHERRRVSYDKKLIGQCRQIAQNKCSEQKYLVDRIAASATWASLGVVDWSGFSALWTWRDESYDNLYESFHFVRDGQGERQRSVWGLTLGYSGQIESR